MFRSIKKLFITTIGFVDWGALISSNPLKIVSMSNQKCRVKLTMVNINSNEPLFHPYSILVNKCSGSSNDINNPYTKLCIPHVKNMNNNLLSKNNETCCVLAWNLCVCRYASVCRDRQHWNSDKCRCECKELVDKGSCDDGFI